MKLTCEDLFIVILCVWVLFHTCMCIMCMHSIQRLEEGIRGPGTRVTDSGELSHGCQGPNHSPLKEHYMLLQLRRFSTAKISS